MTTDAPPVALVTGAGSGMGRSTADAYLTRGWTVVAVDLQPVEVTFATGRLVSVVADVSVTAGGKRASFRLGAAPLTAGNVHTASNTATTIFLNCPIRSSRCSGFVLDVSNLNTTVGLGRSL